MLSDSFAGWTGRASEMQLHTVGAQDLQLLSVYPVEDFGVTLQL